MGLRKLLKPLKPLRLLILKTVLRSALQLEENIYGLFAALPGELAGLELPVSLRHIIAEEQTHQQLLRDMIAGRLPEARMAQLVSGPGPRLHDPGALRALPGTYRPLIERLEPILEQEERICHFFASLERKTRLRVARQAFGFLAAQERVHVRMLRRLLGKPDPAQG